MLDDTVAYWPSPSTLSQVTMSQKHWGLGQITCIEGGADPEEADTVSQVSGSPMYNAHNVTLL